MKAKYICEKKENKEQNGVELYFSVFPLTATRDNLKKHGFRWNRTKKCWYAKKSMITDNLATICAETTINEYKDFANKAGETIESTKPQKTATKKAPAEIINLDNLSETHRPPVYGTELAALIRSELKSRGVKGATVKNDRSSYTTSICVTIKATENDFASVEEMRERYTISKFYCDLSGNRGNYINKERFLNGKAWEEMTEAEQTAAHDNYLIYSATRLSSINQYHLERKEYFELTTNFFEKVKAVYLIANQWNYDNSDSMTDYFDVGYYLSIEIKKPEDFSPRENMTDLEKEQYKEEARKEEEETAARIAQFKKEEEERRKAAEKAEEERKAAENLILSDITVEDLEEENAMYITDCVGGIGKECSLSELNDTISDCPHISDLMVDRKVIFNSEKAYNLFCNMFMDGFDFLAGKGGTTTEDRRLNNDIPFYSLNEKQRETIKWYCVHCVGVYFQNALKLIIDPQGYNYSRYVFLPAKNSQIKPAKSELERQEKETESLSPFYFPAPVTDQIKHLSIGQNITVYQINGWTLYEYIAGYGTITDIIEGNYAQYKGVWIALKFGHKESRVFIRDNQETLIYSGIKHSIPESVLYNRISEHSKMMIDYREILPAILDHYNQQGEKPILDTIQR